MSSPEQDAGILGALMRAVVELQRDVSGLILRDQERTARDTARDLQATRRFKLAVTLGPIVLTGSFGLATVWIQSRTTEVARAQASEIAAQRVDSAESRERELVAKAIAEGRAQRERELAEELAAERRRIVRTERARNVRPVSTAN